MKIKKPTKIVIAVSFFAVVSVVTYGYLLFHGYLDRGLFEIKQTSWYSPIQVAVIAERSDNYALTSYQYFVLIGNHVFSPVELRHLFYSDAPVFSAASSCLSLRWESRTNLVIQCEHSRLAADHINLQKWKYGDVVISYKNIPEVGR